MSKKMKNAKVSSDKKHKPAPVKPKKAPLPAKPAQKSVPAKKPAPAQKSVPAKKTVKGASAITSKSKFSTAKHQKVAAKSLKNASIKSSKNAVVKSTKAPTAKPVEKVKASVKKDLPLKNSDTKVKSVKSVKSVKKDKARGKNKTREPERPTVRTVERKAPATPAAPIKITKEMMEIRARLQTMLGEMRRDIDHEVRGASERDLAHINDTSDMASDAAEGDLALRIAESETVEAEEIERSIEKIDNGTYGICEMCNKPIGVERIKFLPYVTLCIKCQELSEIRRREDGDELDDLAEGAETDNDA